MRLSPFLLVLSVASVGSTSSSKQEDHEDYYPDDFLVAGQRRLEDKGGDGPPTTLQEQCRLYEVRLNADSPFPIECECRSTSGTDQNNIGSFSFTTTCSFVDTTFCRDGFEYTRTNTVKYVDSRATMTEGCAQLENTAANGMWSSATFCMKTTPPSQSCVPRLDRDSLGRWVADCACTKTVNDVACNSCSYVYAAVNATQAWPYRSLNCTNVGGPAFDTEKGDAVPPDSPFNLVYVRDDRKLEECN